MTTAYKKMALGGLAMTAVVVPMLSWTDAGGGLATAGSAIAAFMKGAKIGSVVIGLLFLAFRFGVMKIIVIQEGETGLVVSRGRFKPDKKTGLPKLVDSNRYQLHVAAWRHIAIINNRERTIELSPVFTCAQESWQQPLSVIWSINGDATSMKDALTKVSDGNRFDEKFTALERMVEKQCLAGLKRAFAEAKMDETTGVPVIDFSLVHDDLRQRVGKYGSSFHEVLDAPAHRYNAPYDGNKAIADSVEKLSDALTGIVLASPISDGTGRPSLASA